MTALARKSDDRSHEIPRADVGLDGFPSLIRSRNFHNLQLRDFFAGDLVSPVCVPSVEYAWGRSWVNHHRSRGKYPPKSSGQPDGSPTIWSARFWQTLLERFGLRTRRPASPRPAAVRFVRPNAISAANENGPATPSQPSLQKSCAATARATSRSFPNGERRPF